jgi:hypothetical protein
VKRIDDAKKNAWLVREIRTVKFFGSLEAAECSPDPAKPTWGVAIKTQQKRWLVFLGLHTGLGFQE